MDTRTKHTIAQDRFIVAEQRLINAERRKSVNTIQLLALEQKRLEKRLVSLQNNLTSTESGRPLKLRGRSSSEVIFRNVHRTGSWSGALPIHLSKLSVSLNNSNQNLLTLPKMDNFERRFSASSDGAASDYTFSTSDMESGEEFDHEKRIKSKSSRKKTTNSRRTTSRKRTLPKLITQPTKPVLPIVAVIPPDEENLFLIQ